MKHSITPPLTTVEAAQYLNLKPSTLEVWRCQGRGPRFVRLGRSIRYRVKDLDEFMEKGLRTNTSEVAP